MCAGLCPCGSPAGDLAPQRPKSRAGAGSQAGCRRRRRHADGRGRTSARRGQSRLPTASAASDHERRQDGFSGRAHWRSSLPWFGASGSQMERRSGHGIDRAGLRMGASGALAGKGVALVHPGKWRAVRKKRHAPACDFRGETGGLRHSRAYCEERPRARRARRNFSTYLPSRSASRFTASPTRRLRRFVTSKV